MLAPTPEPRMAEYLDHALATMPDGSEYVIRPDRYGDTNVFDASGELLFEGLMGGRDEAFEKLTDMWREQGGCDG